MHWMRYTFTRYIYNECCKFISLCFSRFVFLDYITNTLACLDFLPPTFVTSVLRRAVLMLELMSTCRRL